MIVRAEIEPEVSIVDKKGKYETILTQIEQRKFRKNDEGESFYIDINGKIVIPLKTGETIYVKFL